MDPPFSPHKTFTDPGAVGGVPRVIKSTPVPRRGAPLPGTRPMLCPRNEPLFEMEGAHPPEAVKPPLTATVMGAIAVAAALGNNVLAWRFMQSDHPLSRHEAWLFFPGIALVLLL